MAIINNLLRGQLKGRIGNNYFATRKSATGRPQTVVGTINTSPSNPRSADQMRQRAKFANAVKFYRHAQANFYKFAFERQKPNETDYNVFMRMNIDRSPVLPKSWVDDPAFLAWSGQWLFSSGTLGVYLRSLSCGIRNRYSGAFLSFPSTIVSPTIGSISRLLIQYNNLQRGDIVTIVVIGVDEPEYDEVNNKWVEGVPPIWISYQFIVDPLSSVELEFLNYRGGTPCLTADVVDDRNVWFYSPARGSGIFTECVAAMVVTRFVNGRMVSSVSPCTYSDNLGDIIEEQLASYTEDEILATWQTQDAATLQGAIASSGEGSGVSSGSGANVTAIVQDSTAWNSSKMATSSLYGVHVKGSNLGELSTDSFTCVNCTPTDYQQVSAQIYELIFRTGSTAGACSVSYGDVTWSGTVVASS